MTPNMLKSVSDRISDFFIRQKIITGDRRAVYSYGLELLLSTLISLLGVGIASLLLKDFLGYLCFLAAFIPFRLWAGGYHADSHFSCFFCFLGIFGAAFAVTLLLPQTIWKAAAIAASVISLCLILTLAPLAHPNKRVNEQKGQRNRKRSFILAILYLILAITWLLLPSAPVTWIFHLFLGEFFAALSLAAGKIKNLRRSSP